MMGSTLPAHEFVFNRSWIYDCALAVIAFSMTKSFDRAERLLTALSGLIDEDGKLGFSYNTQDGWFEKKYWTGAIAWVGYSFVFYQNTTGDNQFQAFAVKIADWVISMQVAGKGSFRGSPDVSWISTEHNIDAYFFLRDIGRITGKIAYVTASHEIRTALLNFHWNSSFGCFQQGDADDTKALDTASWGALFLQSFQFLTPPGGSSIDSCLAFADANFAISKSCTIQGVPRTVAGYTPTVIPITFGLREALESRWRTGGQGISTNIIIS